MEVLAARGNVAEALRAFEDARVLLREELGSSPGPALVALHERLRAARSRCAPAAPVAAAAPPSGLVERDAELALLARIAAEAAAGEGRTALIEGPAGLGKTRLLAELRSWRRRAARACSAPAPPTSSATTRSASCASCSRASLLDPAAAERALPGAAAPARAVFEFAAATRPTSRARSRRCTASTGCA